MSISVNRTALDELVLEHLFHEGEVFRAKISEESNEESKEYNKSYNEVAQVRKSIMVGDIADALVGIRNISSVFEKNLSLLFDILKQGFIELLIKPEDQWLSLYEVFKHEYNVWYADSDAKGKPDGESNTTISNNKTNLDDNMDKQEAINVPLKLIRNVLKPLATRLDQVHSLNSLLLIFSFWDKLAALVGEREGRHRKVKGNEGIPIVIMNFVFGKAEREAISSAIVASVLSSHGIGDSKFSLVLRYLVTVHNQYVAMSGISCDFKELDNLFHHERLDVIHDKGNENLLVRERDVQKLAQAMCITRNEAVDALRRSKGDLNEALVRELSRIRLNEATVSPIVKDYSAHRGLFDESADNSGEGKSVKGEEKKGISEKVKEPTLTLDTVKNMLGPILRGSDVVKEGEGRQISCDWVGITALINDCDSKFFSSVPRLRLSVLRCEVMQLCAQGKHEESVLLTRQFAKEFPTVSSSENMGEILTPVLKIDNLKLNMESLTARNLITGLEQYFSVVQTLLVEMMSHLLEAHTEWFNDIKCDDVFEPFFGLKKLKSQEKDLVDLNKNVEEKKVNEKKKVPWPEAYIESLCSGIGLSRYDALLALDANNGDIEAIFNSYFGF